MGRFPHVFLAAGMLAAVAGRSPAQDTTTRVSVNSAGAQANSRSHGAVMSADGRLVAFRSFASNLVAGDTNGLEDAFVHDRQTGRTTRVSVSSSGAQASGESEPVSMSADGRFVAFWSLASNLVPGDTNGAGDVFVHDRESGRTELVSASPAGLPGDQESRGGMLSADGRYVAFGSGATNLVPGDGNGFYDAFVRDRQTGQTSRVSLGWTGGEANGGSGAAGISSDGRFVLIASWASNLVPGDTNEVTDVFVHDRASGATRRVSVSSSGIQANGQSLSSTMSADGRFVAFQSSATNLVSGHATTWGGVFVHDLASGETTLASVNSSGAEANNVSRSGSISADGLHVAFASRATNLVPGDSNGWEDVFVHDRRSGETVRASLNWTGGQVYRPSISPSISADGRSVAFETDAPQMVPGDTNHNYDIFVRERDGVGDVTTYCTAKINSQLCSPSMDWWGLPSASSAAPFTIEVRELLNNKNGLLFYGLDRAAIPFQGGFLCVQAPLRRTAIRGSGGNPPPNDCSGVHSLEFNALIQSGGDPALVAGAVVRAQYRGRDPGDFSGYGTALSAGLEFLIRP